MRVFVFLLLLVAAYHCRTVQPYERQYLSQPGMKDETLSLKARYESHWRSTVEAQDMSTGLTGGGCACK